MTTGPLEREVKLRLASPSEARALVAGLGATPLRERRLQDDRLLDWPDGRLRHDGCVLRVRQDGDSAALTFKGPPQPSTMKLREEIETAVADGSRLLILLDRLGLEVWFRYQKYRQEFSHRGIVVAIDETPIGTFVELEGEADGITHVVAELGRTADDFVIDSYRDLFAQALADGVATGRDMVFEGTA